MRFFLKKVYRFGHIRQPWTFVLSIPRCSRTRLTVTSHNWEKSLGLLAIAVALSGTSHSSLVALWVFLSGLSFIILCSFVIPLVFKWMSKHCPEGEPVDELYVCATLGDVLATGFVTYTIGIHALFGAFVVGVLILKEGTFAGALVEKAKDLVSGIFLPLYFVSSGLKTSVASK